MGGRRSSSAAGWGRIATIAVLAPAIATVLALALQPGRELGAVSIFLLAVVVASAIGGRPAGLVSSVLGFFALNYFFTEPLHTLRVARSDDVVALAVFLVVAVIVGSLLVRVLEERSRAVDRQREATLLGYLATKLSSGEPAEQKLRDAATAILEPLTLVRAEIRARIGLREHHAVATRAGGSGVSAEMPLAVGDRTFGSVVVVRRTDAGELSEPEARLFGSATRQIAAALERTRLDAQVESSRVESEISGLRAALFSSVTHDLRTPLASIKASVTTMLDGAIRDPEQEHELLKTVLEETDRLNRLVGNIVDLARIRSGALVPAREPSAIEDVLDSVLHRLRHTLANVSVRSIVRPDLPEILIDPVQIDQVLTNVLENAARFSPPEGDILISVSPWRDGIHIRVSDQGSGIPLEDRERVFEPFYRRDPGDGQGGSGLGLAIARAIVLAHGGRIRIEGAPPGGASVIIELPREGTPMPQESS